MEAARNFSELLHRVRFAGETFEVTHEGEVVARITATAATEPATGRTLARLLGSLEPPDAAFADDLAHAQDAPPWLLEDPRDP